MKLKLDLHVHWMEATLYAPPSIELARKLGDMVKERGLDGIALTDHARSDFAFQMKRLVDECCDGGILVIPGKETEYESVEVIELYLDRNLTFRFIAHPGYPGPFEHVLPLVQGIEIDNRAHGWHIDRESVLRAAKSHGLLLLSTSDAHYLEDIGTRYTEVSLEELQSRAKPGTPI